MSDPKDTAAIQDFLSKNAEEEKYEILKHETSKKRALIDSKRVDSQLEKLQQDEKDMQLAKNANYDALTEDQIKELQRNNDEYIESAKSPMYFISDVFNGVVPFFRKNLIFVGAKTGEGKSTAVANIVFNVKNSINPATGKYRRSFVITNEEKAEDVYNRVTALQKGWTYTNHSKFTDEQAKTFTRAIPIWAKDGLITVADNTYSGGHGVSTSLEGIASIFDNLIEKKIYYDVILIDYYQNIIYSQKDQFMSENEVQARLARMLDRYKNIYPAPIVLMGQMNPPDDQDRTPWQQRIKGRKIIADSATFVVEMSADFENHATEWKVWKSRFTESIGKEYKTGWDKGKYVNHDDEFIAKIAAMKLERDMRDADRRIGLPNVQADSGEENGE